LCLVPAEWRSPILLTFDDRHPTQVGAGFGERERKGEEMIKSEGIKE